MVRAVGGPNPNTQGRYNRRMAMIQTPPATLDARATAVYSHLFQALSGPTRLAALQHLASGEHRGRGRAVHTLDPSG